MEYLVEVVWKVPDIDHKFKCQTYEVFNQELRVKVDSYYFKYADINDLQSCKIAKISTGEITFEFDHNKK